MEKAPVERIKRQVIVPFALTLAAVLVAALGSIFYIERQSRLTRFEAELSEAQRVVGEVLEVEGRHLQNELTLLSRDVALRDAFMRQDREAMLRLAAPLFELLKKTSGVSHGYFIAPDQRVFLRIHRPGRHGDMSQLATVRLAAKTKQPAQGVELGDYGRLSLRAVQPWVVDGRLLGYIGIARDVGGLAPRLQRILKAEVFIAVGKQHLDRARWEEGARILGSQGNWHELPNAVVIGRTTASVPPEIRQELVGFPRTEGKTLLRKVSGRYYNIGLSPLVDAGGATIGTTLVMFDVTGERQALLIIMLALTVAVSLFAAGGLFLFYGYIDRLDRRLATLQEQLNEQLAERSDQLSQSTNLLQADIALRQQVEHDFSQISQRHRLILEAAGQGVFGLDADGRHTFVNPAAAAMLGYTPEELLGRESHALCHHTRLDGTPYPKEECPIYQAFKDGKVHRMEQDIFWRKDGTRVWVEYTSTPILENDALTGAVVTFRDITVRKEALEALAENEERYRAITDTAQDAILLMDPAGRVAFWNPAAEKIFGYGAAEIVGQEMHGLLAPSRYREQSQRGIAAFHGTGCGPVVGKTVSLHALRKNGEEFPIELSLAALQRHGEWWAVGIVRDISVRVAAEKERENLQAQVRQAQKMEAIGTLAGGIAHDFNNILGAIIGYTELSLLDASQGRPVTGHLAEIRRAGERAKELVAHILTFSRQAEMRQQPMSVVPVIKEALKLLRASLPAEIEIRQQIDPKVGKIMADPVQIHQCLMNLCTNAAQAMREKGGVLEVTLAEEELHADAAPPEYGLTAGWYLGLTVADTGHGMDQETLARIFEPFYSTRQRDGEGAGLGLAVVHGIMKSHGGGIVVESERGQGTTFHLYFPLLAPTVAEPASSVVVAPLPAGGKERILLVDDEVPLVEMGQRILEYLGYVVTAMTSSTEALALFTAQPQAFDLIITDQSMPHLTGVEMARQMLAIRPELPVVLCTGFSETVGKEQAKAMGINGYVMKPLSINDLATACRDALASRE